MVITQLDNKNMFCQTLIEPLFIVKLQLIFININNCLINGLKHFIVFWQSNN